MVRNNRTRLDNDFLQKLIVLNMNKSFMALQFSPPG